MLKKIIRIFSTVREYKKFAIMTPLFMVGEALLECLLPFVMSILIDTIGKIRTPEDFFTFFKYTNENLHFEIHASLFWVIMTLVIMALLSLACGICGGIFASKASVGMATNLRDDLYRKVQTFSFANIDKFSAASLVTRMTTDVTSVQNAFQMCIRIVFRAPLMMIFSAVMSFFAGGVMSLIFVSILPIVAFGLFLLIRSAMKIFRRLFHRYDLLNESVEENVTGMRVVKSFVREEYEKEKFNTASNNMTNDFIKAEKIVALNNPIMNTAIHLANILVIAIGAIIISRTASLDGEGNILYTSLSIGQLSSLLTYGIQILMSLMMVSIIMVMLTMSLEAVRRIDEVLEEIPTIKNPENAIFEVEDGSVDFNNVNFKYFENAEKNTLENINLHIKSGQFIGVIGSTGSGKTSLVNLISRLYDINEGELLVGGKDVKSYDLKTLRDAVSVVLQKNVLFSGTIADNLRWGDLNASDEELIKASKIAQAEEFINSFPDGYKTYIEQGGSNVSGGQKQRLCIARAIVKKPKILILDDSTSAVDTKTDSLIRKGLKEDIPETTKIVIAQRISSIEDADQIIVMDNGRIDAVGTHSELLKSNQIYQEVYYTQNKVGGGK